jgi:hypothetical protein
MFLEPKYAVQKILEINSLFSSLFPGGPYPKPGVMLSSWGYEKILPFQKK